MTFIVPAFLLGLFGSAHCVMMCGGIASALSGSLVQLGRKPKPTRSTLGYNVGRIASYVLLGALVGAIGRAVDFVPWFGAARIALRFVAGAMLVGAGLWVAGAWNRFSVVERIGAPVWRRVQPFASRLVGSPGALASVGVGALWGLMPCGLVYAAFGLALASGTIGSGAMVMAAFGLGTAPAMIATGLASARIVPALRGREWIRRAAGVLVVVFGLVDVASATDALRHPVPVCCQHHHHH
jgi:sulfite exporter TauE/SafE